MIESRVDMATNTNDMDSEATSSSPTSKQIHLQQSSSQPQSQPSLTLNRRSHLVKQYENYTDTDQSTDNLDQLEKENDDPNGANSKHVGPLGIFFKVWSLVKVTKVRHQQNKLRRQNSEEAATQFRYISADQFNAANLHLESQVGERRQPPAMLSDSHFRRAGSQPASLGFSGGANESTSRRPTLDSPLPSTRGGGVPGSGSAANRLQMQAAQQATSSSATNSTSSGVSSATSSTLASTEHQPTATTYLASSAPITTQQYQYHHHQQQQQQESSQSSSSFANIRRQALAAYNSRRTTTELGSPIISPTGAGSRWRLGAGSGKADEVRLDQKQQRLQVSRNGASSGTGGGGGWASRIRRSATSIIHTDASKYRAGTGSGQLQQKPTNKRTAAIQKQQQQQQEPLRLRRVSEPSCDDLENQSYVEENGGLDDDDDSNDIYSTPHDSIQSVPSFGGPIKMPTPQPAAFVRSGGVNYPIIKSFSTNSFGQSVRLADQSDLRFKPTNGLAPLPDHESGQFKEDNDENDEDDDQATDLITSEDQFRSQDSNETTTSHATKTSKLTGSRFFISSSSSEDSNSPSSQQMQLRLQQNQLQDQSQLARQTTDQRTQVSSSQDQPKEEPATRPRVELHQGVHHHHHQQQQTPVVAAALHRPDFLPLVPAMYNYVDLRNGHFLASPAGGAAPQMQPLFASRLVMTPGGICAVSPQEAPTFAPFVGPASPHFHLPTGGYKKSPSLFEISNCKRHVNGKFLGNRVAPPVAPPLDSESNLDQQQQQQQHEQQQQQRDPRPGQRMPNSISLHDCKLTVDNRTIIQRPQLVTDSDADNYMEIGVDLGHANRTINDDLDFKFLLGPEVTGDSGQATNGSAPIDSSEYKLTQMLLEFGSNPSAKDQFGQTALMHAIMSDNLPAVKCLIERGVDLNSINRAEMSALDLLCSKAANELRILMLKMLIEARAKFDETRPSDGTRLLDRLISLHRAQVSLAPSSNPSQANKLPYIECLLENGAKLGSSTWAAASGKVDVQLRLLRKLCHDGYFLYKKSSIEPAVYRFEYAIRQLDLLERQLQANCVAANCRDHGATGNEAPTSGCSALWLAQPTSCNGILTQETARLVARQIRYQIYLGLSRCERKRKFYKRALEFAHLAILVDSNAYEAFYSKAHILKDFGETDDSLLAVDQSARIINKSIEFTRQQLKLIDQQEAENLLLDRCFGYPVASDRAAFGEAPSLPDSVQGAKYIGRSQICGSVSSSYWINSILNSDPTTKLMSLQVQRGELRSNLEYLSEARNYVAKLRNEILEDKRSAMISGGSSGSRGGSRTDQIDNKSTHCNATGVSNRQVFASVS